LGSSAAGASRVRASGSPGTGASATGAARDRPASAGDSPGFLLWRATLRWQRVMGAALAPVGLTHVQFVLLASTYWLGRTGAEPPNQRELAEHASTDVMMTSQVLRALEERGLVVRTPDPSDARARHLSVTVKGARLARRAMAFVEEADRRFFAELAASVGQQELVAALRVLAGWDPST